MASRDYNGFTPEQRARSTPWQKRQYVLGLRPRPSECLACGQTEGFIVGHWEDYTEPFGDHNADLAMCHRCHMMLHGRFRAPAIFHTYSLLIREGYRFPVLDRRDTPTVFRQMALKQLPGPPQRVRLPQTESWFERGLLHRAWLRVPPIPLANVTWIPGRRHDARRPGVLPAVPGADLPVG